MAETFNVGGVTSDRPFKIRRFGHIGLYTSDMDVSLEFYTNVLGFAISDPLDLGENMKDAERRKELAPTVVYFMRHNTDHHSFVLFPKKFMNALFGGPDWSEFSINQTSWQVATLREVREGIDWFEKQGIELSRFGRDIPGSNWHAYPFDPERHVNEIFCGMEQIGWDARSKPINLFAGGRQYHGKPALPHVSEAQEIVDAERRGVDITSGYRPEPDVPGEVFDVGGWKLPRPFKIVKVGPERLFVRDLDGAVRFYQDVLGFALTEETLYKGHRSVFLRVGTEHHSLALYPIALRDELGWTPSTTLFSVGLQLGEYSQLKNAIPYFTHRGIRVEHLPAELSPGIDYSVCAFDPDGHALQLYFHMEQLGWDGKPRPQELRSKINNDDWPDTLAPDADTYGGETFLGPFG